MTATELRQHHLTALRTAGYTPDMLVSHNTDRRETVYDCIIDGVHVLVCMQGFGMIRYREVGGLQAGIPTQD